MKIVMDSDCLVKLTKAGAKELVAASIEVYIPHLVKKETVDDVKVRGYQDSYVIEENISRDIIKVVRHEWKGPLTVPVSKGEREVLSLYLKGGYDAIASDDRKFLKKLGDSNIPSMTPTACIVYIYYAGKLGKPEVLELLERLRPMISNEEYTIAKFYMEGKK